MHLAALSLFATLVIDGQVYDNAATSHTFYHPGPSHFPELHIQTEIGMECKIAHRPSSRETKVIVDRQSFTAHTVEYWPRLNIWFIETRGNVRCEKYRG